MRDLHIHVRPEASLSPAVHNADANGASIDLAGAEAAEVIVVTGAYTDGTFPVVLEESDDNATFTAVDAADLLGSAPVIDAAGKADSVFNFGYIGNKRYVRVSLSGSVAGGTGAHIAACVVEARLRHGVGGPAGV